MRVDRPHRQIPVRFSTILARKYANLQGSHISNRAKGTRRIYGSVKLTHYPGLHSCQVLRWDLLHLGKTQITGPRGVLRIKKQLVKADVQLVDCVRRPSARFRLVLPLSQQTT